MPRLVVPTAAQIRTVLEESHALWGAGLSLGDYLGMWEELAATPWGRKWFAWRALADDDGRILSSLKLYRPAVRVGGAVSRAAAIGAVYTPRAHRRRGHAAALIRATLDEAARRRETTGLLFTDIGTAYYAALEFEALPCEDLVGTLAPPGRPSRVAFRPVALSDLDAMARAHDRFCAPRTLAILRDRDHWEFLLARAGSFFRRLDGSGLGRRFVVAVEHGAPVGYVVGVEGSGEWNLREAAAYDGSAETLARILRAAAATAHAAGAQIVWGWLPRSWMPIVPEWRLVPRPRARAIPMIRPRPDAAAAPGIDTVDGALIPYLDQF